MTGCPKNANGGSFHVREDVAPLKLLVAFRHGYRVSEVSTFVRTWLH